MITSPKNSPFQVTYDDLIASSEERLRKMAFGSGWHWQHAVEVEKRTLALLKKFKKDPQIDLFKEFEKQK